MIFFQFITLQNKRVRIEVKTQIIRINQTEEIFCSLKQIFEVTLSLSSREKISIPIQS